MPGVKVYDVERLLLLLENLRSVVGMAINYIDFLAIPRLRQLDIAFIPLDTVGAVGGKDRRPHRQVVLITGMNRNGTASAFDGAMGTSPIHVVSVDSCVLVLPVIRVHWFFEAGLLLTRSRFNYLPGWLGRDATEE